MNEEEAMELIWDILMEDEPNWKDIAAIFDTRTDWDQEELKYLLQMWPEDMQDAYHEQVLKMKDQEFIDETIDELKAILSEDNESQESK